MSGNFIDSPVSRRTVLQRGAVAAIASAWGARVASASRALPLGTLASVSATPGVPDMMASWVDPVVVKQLALRAIDAAKAAGATYADVRLTRTIKMSTGFMGRNSGGNRQDDYSLGGETEEKLGVGVRAMINGAWGFAASSIWRLEEMVALANAAAAQATACAKTRRSRPFDWAPAPTASGHWTMPVEIDPFTVPIGEIMDCLDAIETYAARREMGHYGRFTGTLWRKGRRFASARQERALATTEGTYVTQVTYDTQYDFYLPFVFRNGYPGSIRPRGLAPRGRGWEIVREVNVRKQLDEMIARRDTIRTLPLKPFEPGRFDIVTEALLTGYVVEETLGRTTELDRALGYEANASGTSWIGPKVLDLLGTFKVGSSALTLTADRSMAGGVATVKWDDEGVEPETTTLIRDGVLSDYQTTREQAAWLAPYYQTVGVPISSHGYAGAESALHPTRQAATNLTMAPNASDVVLEDLIKDVKKGYILHSSESGAIEPAYDMGIEASIAEMDYQGKTSVMRGSLCREIVNGKLGAIVSGFRVNITAPQLWKSLMGVGGISTVRAVDPLRPREKGEPRQSTRGSVRAPAALFKDIICLRD